MTDSDSQAATEASPAVAAGLWQNRNFLLLFFAQVISLLGSGVTTVALALFAYELTGGKDATAVVGNALMLRILAFLIFSQPAGVMADRVSRRWLLVLLDLGRFALLALFPFITQVWQVYLLIFAINALTAAFTPTYEATIPQVVGRAAYIHALSLSRVAVDVEAVLGPLAAGMLVALVGVRLAFWFDGLTYLVSAVLILASAIPRLDQPAERAQSHWLADILYGARLLLGEPALRQALIASFCEATAGAAAIVATVTYVRGVLGKSEFAAALAMAAVGAGSSLAALLYGRLTAQFERGADSAAALHQRRHRAAAWLMLSGATLLSLILLAAGAQPPLWMFALLWAANGVGQAIIALPSVVLLAEHTLDHERGRAYAAHFALTHACWLVTYPAIGYAAAAFGTPATFSAAGLVCLLVTLATFVAGRGSDRPHVHPT